MTTTAEYRNLAHVACNNLNFAEAARLYTLAADVYPVSNSALAALDIARLRRYAASCAASANDDVSEEIERRANDRQCM